MKFRISGADEHTGADREVTVEADDETLALTLAKEQGVFPYCMEITRILPEADPSSIAPHARRKTRSERKQDEKMIVGIIAGVFMLLLLFGFTVVSNWFSNHSQAASNASPVYRGNETNATTGRSVLRREVIGATNEAVYDRMMKLNIAGDRTGFSALMDEGVVILLDNGTNIRVIDPGVLKTEIRVESGPCAGRYLIVDAVIVSK